MNESKQEIALPDNLIDLLKLAVHDARLCIADNDYELDMYKWHTGKGHYGVGTPTPGRLNGARVYRERCAVNMAGAIIAKTLNGDITKDIDPKIYGRKRMIKLYILDSICLGFWGNVKFKELGWPVPKRTQLEIDSYYVGLSGGDINEWERMVTNLEETSDYGKD